MTGRRSDKMPSELKEVLATFLVRRPQAIREAVNEVERAVHVVVARCGDPGAKEKVLGEAEAQLREIRELHLEKTTYFGYVEGVLLRHVASNVRRAGIPSRKSVWSEMRGDGDRAV